MMQRTARYALALAVALIAAFSKAQTALEESLPPLPDGKSPQTLDAVWAGYDPQKEPLDIEVAREWEEDGVVLRLVRYRIGVFRGRKAMMAGFYGFPKGGENLPALVQTHGGGQAANTAPCLYAAKRGYACISLNWRAERFHSYRDVSPEVQTDWGAVAGKQEKAARGIEPGERKFDPVPSGRNEGYFLRVLAARRALTFLERQPEVDGSKLGIYGHSMGGVISVETAAIDPRVKAVAPSAGPPLNADDGSLVTRTADARAFIPKLACPVLFMNPANDFHGKIEEMETIIDGMPSKDYRLARVPHLNHRDKAPFLAAIPLWFDAKLKGSFEFPGNPGIALQLRGDDGRPVVSVTPDSQLPIASVDIYFTRQGDVADYLGSKSRFWHHAKATTDGAGWKALLDLEGLDRPLWVYANVHHTLQTPVGWHSYYYGSRGPSNQFAISTRLKQVTAEDLRAANVKATEAGSRIIEDFRDGWQQQWYTYGEDLWPWRTQKLCDRQYVGGGRDKLVLQLTSAQPNKLVVGFGEYFAEVSLAGSEEPQVVSLYPFDLRHQDSGVPMLEWTDAPYPSLVIGAEQKLKRKDEQGRDITLGGEWDGPLPTFHELRWETASATEFDAKRPFPLGRETAARDGRTRLTLAVADSVVGRSEAKQKNIAKPDLAPGFEVHSPGEITFFLNRQFVTLHTTLVTHRLATIAFEIYADGKQVYSSGLVTGKTPANSISVPVANVRELKLVVSAGGNGTGGDWGMWTDTWLAR